MAARKHTKQRQNSINIEPRIKAECDRLLAKGLTYREIADHLQGMGAETSKSSVARYHDKWSRVNEDVRMSRELTDALVNELGAADTEAGRLLAELGQGLLLRWRTNQDDPDAVELQDVQRFARAFKDLESGKKLNIETRNRIRETVLVEAAAAVEKVGKAEGLTRKTINTIKAEVLGMKVQQ